MSNYYCSCEACLPEDLREDPQTCFSCGGIIRGLVGSTKRPSTQSPPPPPESNGETAEGVPQEKLDLLRKRAESAQEGDLMVFCTPEEILPLLDEIESLRVAQAAPPLALASESAKEK